MAWNVEEPQWVNPCVLLIDLLELLRAEYRLNLPNRSIEDVLATNTLTHTRKQRILMKLKPKHSSST